MENSLHLQSNSAFVYKKTLTSSQSNRVRISFCSNQKQSGQTYCTSRKTEAYLKPYGVIINSSSVALSKILRRLKIVVNHDTSADHIFKISIAIHVIRNV